MSISPPTFALGRPLSAVDVELALRSPAKREGEIGGSVRRTRASFHNIAILVSRNRSKVEISRITGYSLNDISLIELDPSFQDLVASYRNTARVEEPDLTGQMSAVAQAAIAEILHRLETEPEKINARDLERFASFGTDRIGHGPTSTVNLNKEGGVTQVIEALKTRYMEVSRGRELSPSEVRAEDAEKAA